MKKITLFMLLCVTYAFAACEKDLATPEQEQLPIPVTGIVIDEPTHAIALDVAENKTLQATVAPENATNKNIVWSSDDQTIATVSTAGVVTGVKAGSTKIWAKSEEDSSIKNACEVTVTNTVVSITQITLDPEHLSIEIEQTKNLTATVAPENATDRNVTWDSSDKTVATVSKTGSVTGLKIGKTTITVTSNADSKKSATCEVTVTEKSIPATDMWMKTTKLGLKIAERQPLTAATIPTNTTDQTMVWSSDDTTIATVDTEGVVTGIAPGTTIVWVKWGSDHSIKDKCTVTVLADSSYAVGDLYPNAQSPIGVVFWKDPANPAKGKIVSLTETRIEWAKGYTKTFALNEDDGVMNMETIRAISGWETSYLAFKWCSDLGDGWYLPAISEMQEIYKTKDAINAAIAKTSVDGAHALYERDYWTSTEKKDSQKYYAVIIQCYQGHGGGGAPAGGTSFADKDMKQNTRAIKNFDNIKK